MNEYVRAYEGMKPYVFISYSHLDKDRVLPVIQALYSGNYRAWYDEGIAPGSEWPKNIAKHLRNASAFIAFVSKNYLSSANCENEARLAVGHHVKIIPVCLDGISTHPLFSNLESLMLDDAIAANLTRPDSLGPEFVGDGIDGYQYEIERKISFNFWNLMLGFAVVLVLVLSAALYGLYSGFFDHLLPAKQTAIQTAVPTPEPQKVISINDNVIGSVLPVAFPSVEEKNAVYQLLGWNQPFEMTYQNLVGMEDVTQLEISSEPITDLSFAVYLPNLEMITLVGSGITDLSPLADCPKLKIVRVSVDMLPVTIPESRNFQIEVI